MYLEMLKRALCIPDNRPLRRDQMAWHGNPLRGRWLLISYWAWSVIYFRLLSWFLWGFFSNLLLSQNLKHWHEHEHPFLFGPSSSLSSFSSSWRPCWRATESPSPPSLHPESAFAPPPPSTFLLFPLIKPSPLEVTTSVIRQGSLLAPCRAPAESVRASIYLHLAEFVCIFLSAVC